MYNESNYTISEPHMTVSGTGVSKTLPDRFSVSFEINFEEAEDKYVYHYITGHAAKLLDALKEWAQETDTVESSRFTLDHYVYSDKKTSKWRYGQLVSTGSISVTVTSGRLEEAAAVTQLGKESGATDINYVHYFLSPELKLKEAEKALENAVAKAKSDAEITAKAFGIRLTGMLHVDVNNYAANVSYRDDEETKISLDSINDCTRESFHETPDFLKAGYVETRASVDAVYAIGEL